MRHWIRTRVAQVRREPEAGLSLAEMMVAILLTGLLSTVLLNAFVASTRGQRHVADDAAIQQEQQTVVERLSRDLRLARELEPGTGSSELIMWDDLNSDYSRQPDNGEVITWQLKATAGGGCEIVRTAGGPDKVLSVHIANTGCAAPASQSDYAFTFFGPTPSVSYGNATGVSVSLSFRASAASTANARQAVFSVRMRNVSVP